MRRIIEFESLNEEILFALFEMDRDTIRYYVQPVRINVPYINEEGSISTWNHIPDVLAFRQGSLPHLFQIKDIIDSENKSLKNCNINEACQLYAKKRNWVYSVVRPKQLPAGILHNIKFLIGFIKEREIYKQIIPELISNLSIVGTSTIIDLAGNIDKGDNSLLYLPAIYHLMAKGIFKTDLNNPINACSQISVASQKTVLSNLLIGGMFCEVENN